MVLNKKQQEPTASAFFRFRHQKKGLFMQKPMNLQDQFLNAARKEKIEVTAFLTNGFQLHGYVRAFDSFVVLFSCDGKQNLVYKHALSTIAPTKELNIRFDSEDKDEE